MTDTENGAASTTSTPSSGGSSEPLFRGVGKHALIYGLGMVLSRAVSFIMLPIYTRYLTPADYGVMSLIEMTLDFIAIVGGAQLALGVFRFYHKTDREDVKQQVVSTSLMLVGLLYGVVSCVVLLAAGPLSDLIFGSDAHVDVIRVAALNLGSSALLIVPMTFARVKELSVFFVGANLAKLLLGVTFNILFIVVMGLGVIGIFFASLIANALVGGFLVIWLIRRAGTRPSVRWTKDLLRYGIPLMGMQVATFVATFSDRYFLQGLSDESVVGLYSLAYQFGFLLVMVGFTPINMVWGPKRFEVAKRNDAGKTLATGFVLVNMILLTTAVGITLYVGDVLRIMAAPAFHSAADVVPIILVAYVFQAWASVQDIGILVKERTQYLTLANVISALVAVAGYALLIPPFLEWGAAFATVLAFATRYILTYRFSQSMWAVRYRWRPVWILVAWAAAVAGTSLILPRQGVVASLGVHTALVVVYFAGLWFLPILRPNERAALHRFGVTAARRISRKDAV